MSPSRLADNDNRLRGKVKALVQARIEKKKGVRGYDSSLEQVKEMCQGLGETCGIILPVCL